MPPEHGEDPDALSNGNADFIQTPATEGFWRREDTFHGQRAGPGLVPGSVILMYNAGHLL